MLVICLFENIRFFAGEEKNDLDFAKNISKHFDAYVNDAFSVSHRNHASIVGIPNFLPSYAGDSMINEISNILSLKIMSCATFNIYLLSL